MSLTKWSPFQDVLNLQDQMNSLFNHTFRGIDKRSDYTDDWQPLVDIYEDSQNIYLEAELPGLKEKDIKLKIEDSTLTLSGERKWNKEEKKEGYHRIERSFGSFMRSFNLPSAVDREKIVANYKDGVLKVTLPRKEEEKPRQIEVKVS